MNNKVISLLILPAFAALSLTFSSCKEKKETTDIIAPKPVKKAPSAPVKMQAYTHNEDAEWLGKTYHVSISRSVDADAPVFDDGTGNKYHDNKISLKVLRDDNTVFFERSFTKNSFSSNLDEKYLSCNTLLGLVFIGAEGDNLKFSVSVGSPDALSDEYVPLSVVLSRMGNITVKKDARIDSAAPGQEEDEGV